MNVFERIKRGDGIFLDERRLLPDYIPDDILHREREIRELAFCLEPSGRGGKCENALLTGPPGTGKTTCAKHVLSQLSEHTKKALPIYINCWEFSSRHAIFSEIAGKLGEVVPRRGVSADEALDRVLQAVRREKKAPVIALDEADRLFLEEEEGIFYDLARAGEVHGVHFGVVAIANRKEYFSEMEPRIRSSFSPKGIEFKPYSPDQLKEILKGRARAAFSPEVLDSEVIPMCAGIGAKHGGDARIAISVLHGAGKEAEREGGRKVLVSHVQKAKERILSQVGKRKLPALSPELQGVFESVEKAVEIESGELYKRMGAKSENEERVLRKYVSRLEEMGFLESELIRKGTGKTRVIRIRK